MTNRGFWMICRTCLFPIRLPYPLTSSRRRRPHPSSKILLACPVCAHVLRYKGAQLETIAFRVPDPFRRKTAVLYEVEIECSVVRCRRPAKIYAVGATTISVARLVDLWEHWVIHARCPGHVFEPLPLRTWGARRVPAIVWNNGNCLNL